MGKKIERTKLDLKFREKPQDVAENLQKLNSPDSEIAQGKDSKEDTKAATRRIAARIRQKATDSLENNEPSATPTNGTETIKTLQLEPAKSESIPEIMNTYDSLLYDRNIFKELCDPERRKDEQFVRSKLKILASGGELCPISAEEWAHRIENERVQLVKNLEGNLIGANSYIFPDTVENAEIIKNRLLDITRYEQHTRWFRDEVEIGNARRIIMIKDTFFKPGSGKGLLHETYRAMLHLEMERNPALKEDIHNFFIYYYVNSFVNVSPEGEEMEQFLVPGFNRATVVSTTKMDGDMIGLTHPDEYKKLVLPDIKPGSEFKVNGKRILIDRPFIDLIIPASSLLI